MGGRSALKKGVSTIARGFGYFFKLILKIWKPIIFIVGFALIISLIVSCVVLVISFLFSVPFANFLFGSTLLSSLAAANIFFIVAIPILSMLLVIGRLLFKKTISNTWRSGLLAFWIFNIVGLFAFGSKMGYEFNQEESITLSEDRLSFTQDTIRLNLSPRKNDNSIIKIGNMKIVDENLVSDHVHIKIKKSKDEHFKIRQSHYSRGANTMEVNELASTIEYQPIISNDEIEFPSEFIIPKGKKWRNQKVTLTLEIPEGKSIVFPKKAYRFSRHLSIDRDLRDPSMHYSDGNVWTMKEEGFYSKENATQEMGKDLGFDNFRNVIVRGAFKIKINKGEKFEVNVKGKGRYLEDVKMEQVGETLDIQLGKGNHKHYNSPVHLYITAPDLERVDLEKTDDVNIYGFDGKKLSIINEGHHEVKAFVDVDSLYLSFKENKSDIRGKGKYLKVKLEDGARLDAEHYVASNAFVKAEDAKRIKIEVVDTLRHNLFGNSEIDYDVKPKVIIDDREQKIGYNN